MGKSINRRSGRRACVALTAVLLASCSLPAMLGSDHSNVRGLVSFNGAASSDDYSALYKKGKAHFATGQFGLAANEFQAALAEKPDSIEILNALGATYDRLARFDVADRYYKEALAFDPKDPQTLNNLAYSLMLRGDPQHAIPLLNVAQSASAADPMIAANLALAKRLEKKLDQPAVADRGPNDKELGRAPNQEAAAGPAKSLWIERRSEGVQELVFAGGAGAKTPAREWNLGSAALVVQLPPAPKASGKVASNDAPEATVQAIPASYHSAPSKEDSDSPVAAPLTPVSRSQVVELKPTPGTSSGAGEPKQIAETVPSPPVRLAEPAVGAPIRLVEMLSAEPTTKATNATNASAPPDHARSISVETAMAPAAGLPSTTASRKVAFQSPEPSRRSTAGSIEISNGAGKTGMASRFRTFVKAHGFDVRRLTNDRTFSNARTVAYYKPGFEDSARKLAALLSVPVARESASAGRCEVRLRLGHDLVRFYETLQRGHASRAKS